jgi:hypothetical protein
MSVAFRTALIQTLSLPTDEKDPDAHNYERGPSLYEAWKAKVWQEAQKREWDVDTLAFQYHEWTQGEDIREADASKLQAFYESLVPPKRVQRAPLKPVGDAS